MGDWGTGGVVQPSCTVVSHELLFSWKGSLAFPRPGTWELRAVVRNGDATYYSEPSRLVVQQRPPGEEELIVSRDRELVAVVHSFGLGSKQEKDFVLQMKGVVQASKLLEVLDLIGAIYDLGQVARAKLPEQEAVISKMTDRLSQVEREYVKLVLVRAYLARGEIDRAERVLSQVKDQSVEKADLAVLLEETRKKAGKP
jgi:hypothetical protein